MKKTYIIPQTKTVSIAVQRMVCGSDSIRQTTGVDGLGVGGNTSNAGVNSANSRGGGLWDDEDF